MSVQPPDSDKPDRSRHAVYSVVLHHYAPSFTGRSPGSVGTTSSSATASPPVDVALHARFKVRNDRICLVLTYDPCKQPRPASRSGVTTPAAQKQKAGFADKQPRRRSSKLRGDRLRSPVHPPGSAKTKPAACPPTALDPLRHPKQYYIIELQEISPLAAQLPLSADLRGHLRLNLVDGEAATYSSHSTPRATTLSLGSGANTIATTAASSSAAAAAVSSNFYFPPSRAQPVMSQRTRQESPLAPFTAMTAPSYGQYLSASEPYRVHTRSLHTPPTRSGLGSRQHSTSVGEDDFTMVHASRPASHRSSSSSPSSTPLLMPQREAMSAGHLSLSEKNSGGNEEASTPQIVLSPTLRLDTVSDYADLLLVAFFGVPISAGVPNLSFTTSPKGDVLVEKKPKKLSSRVLPKSLFKWFVPSKPVLPPRRSVSTLSTISGIISNSTGSLRCSPAQANAPSELPGNAPAGSRHTAAAATAAKKSKTSAPVPIAVAHVDPHAVLELPFTLNKYDTFHLRFVCEEDLHNFLARYVELQTRLREAAAEAKKASAAVSSPLWHPQMRGTPTGPYRPGQSRFRSGGDSSSDTDMSGEDETGDGTGVDTASTASYTEYPRNADAVAGCGGGGGDPLSADTQRDTTGPLGEPHRRAATSPVPPTVFFRSRGWEEYLRYNLDPRFGVPFASFPLFLWHAFLPLARLVLYTCHRGFLIVERVPPEAAPSDDDVSANASYSTDGERTLEMGKQRLNALVNRLLTPIRTAQNMPPRHPPPASRVNRHGVVEVLPVAPLPLGDSAGAGDGDDSFNSSSTGSWDAVKLVLPSADEAAGQHHDDHFTTVKDVFLCLSESHLLFMNSFGHLRFQCSLDEIALITHSAATAEFPTYPFFRFRMKSSDYAGAPTFVLTFTLLPEVPHEIRAASLSRLQRIHQSQQPGDSHRHAQPASPSPLSSSRGSSPPSESLTAADRPVNMLGDDEKERLLRRHEEFLHIFAAVCPRPLDRHTFADMIAGEMGRSSRVRFSHLTAGPRKKVSGSPISRFGDGASSWMTQNYNTNPILCVKVEADDIELYDTEVGGEGRQRTSGPNSARTTTMTAATSADSSFRHRDRSLRRRSKTSMSPELRCRHPVSSLTPRWGQDDPGIVLQDAGRDMDFSLEVATRSMPLLVTKEEVHVSFGSAMASAQHSFYPDHEENKALGSRGAAGDGGREGEEEGNEFVPMAPKKKKSIILHRTAMKEQ